jgi:hypothetical protein
VSYISKSICFNGFVIKINEVYSQILNSYITGDNEQRRCEKESVNVSGNNHFYYENLTKQKKKYNLLTKPVDITAGSPYSCHWLLLFKTALHYVPTEHRYHALSFCWPFLPTHHRLQSNIPHHTERHALIPNIMLPHHHI